MELGLLFKNLLDSIKLPDRDRSIRLLKMAMVILKRHNNLSKYAYEIMRLLVHQQSSLSVCDAHQEFYGMFVDTSGKIDSHIAVDDRMEWCVGVVKKHIKHMFGNKTAHNITTRTTALSGIGEISQNYDTATKVVVRCQKHSVASALEDEMAILEDLRKLRPFEKVPGRYHPHFPEEAASILQNIDVDKIHGCPSSVGTEKYNMYEPR